MREARRSIDAASSIVVFGEAREAEIFQLSFEIYHLSFTEKPVGISEK